MADLAPLDPRRMLAMAFAYRTFSKLIVRSDFFARLLHIFDVRPGMHILDLGCGPAQILQAMPTGIQYCGVDCSEDYITAARNNFGERGAFLIREVGPGISFTDLGQFDLIIAIGVVHHLGDATARAMFESARAALRPSGRFITLDPVFTPRQNPIARSLISMDRGKFVRNESSYLNLARTCFSKPRATLINDLLRVPYTHIILECQHDGS